MPIQFDCENCQKKLKVPESAAGKRGRCNQCGHLNTIPAAASAETISDMKATKEGAVADQAPVPQPIGSGSGSKTYSVKSAVNGAVFGPADSATLQGWLDEGRITPNCQLQQTGTETWKMAGTMFPALGAAAGVAASAATVNSGDTYAQFKKSLEAPENSGELNPYAPAPQLTGGPKVSGEIVPTAGDIGFCISHGWKVWTENFGLLLAVSATVFGVNMVFQFMQQGAVVGIEAGADPAMIGIGILAITLVSMIVQWWLLLGFLKITCKLCRGERAEYSMLFGGAKKLPVLILIQIVVMIPMMIFIAAIAFLVISSAGGNQPNSLGLVAVLVMLPVVMILSLLIWPVFFMLADSELGFGSLSKGISVGIKNVLISIPIGFVACFAGFIGFLGCGIGVIATIPACYTIMSTAYLNMSGQLRPR